MAAMLPLLTDLGATPHYSFQCELDGVTYTFEVIWNDRDGFWYMQVGDSTENPLVGAIKLVLGKSLLQRFPGNAALPPGFLTCVDTSGQQADAGLADLGSRVQVWYYTQADLAGF
jgi:hypothetical protein